jgi:uncharacterized protein (TIGR03435 family)
MMHTTEAMMHAKQDAHHGTSQSMRTLLRAVVTTLTALISLCVANNNPIHAQPQGAATSRPAFAVASIKAEEEVKAGRDGRVTPVGIDFMRFPLRILIAEAYDVTRSKISSPDPRVMELLDRGTYDVVAKADHEVPKAQLMLMLQTLLADRFKLTLHHESKVEPVFNLVVGANGPKLRESVGDGEPEFSTAPNGGAVCRNMTMLEFSRNLTGRMGRVVVDQTGLKGRYDFTLELDRTPGSNQIREAVAGSSDPGAAKRAMAAAMNDWSTSSIFSDIQKQLGLKLEADKSPVDGLVVDHVEKPSAN